MVVAIVGPSRAGKTELVKLLLADHTGYGLSERPDVLDLDESLGPSSRSDVAKAVALVRSEIGKGTGLALVNVGAGQIVPPGFRRFLSDEPTVFTVAIWCDPATFRSRHSPETAEWEYRNNFGPDLTALWDSCRARHQLVDTSSPHTKERSAEALAAIIRRFTG